MASADFNARTTSIELRVIEECIEDPTDNIEDETLVQNAGENNEVICDGKSENRQLENKDNYDRKTDSKVTTTAADSKALPKPAKRKFSLRKKSHVEFCVKPDVRQGNVELSTTDKLNAERLSPPQARRTRQRQSFSGRSSTKNRPLRFSVGANHQPKELRRESFSAPATAASHDDIRGQNDKKIKIFIELDELNYGDRTWLETTRWMKYEEHVLPSGNWSRPQVPFVEYEGFIALKNYLHEGLVFLEFSSQGLLDFTHTLATTLTMCNRIQRRYRLKIQQLLYLPVNHQGDTARRLHTKKCYRLYVEKIEAEQRAESMKKAFELSSDRVRNLWVNLSHKASLFSKFSAASYDDDSDDADEAIMNISVGGIHNQKLLDLNGDRKVVIRVPDDRRSVSISEFSEANSDRYPLSGNQEHLLKALSPDCEGVAIKYAPCDFLNEYESFVVLVRMTNSVELSDFLEVPIDCKFVFLLCGSSKGDGHKDLQVCRAFGSLMTDKVFQHDMLTAHKKQDVITAIDKYVQDSVLFPPGQWDLDYLKPATEEITHLSAKRHVLRTQTVKTPPRKRKKSYAIQQPLISEIENHQSRKPSSALPLRRDTVISADDIASFLNGQGGSRTPSIVYSPLLSTHPLEPDGRWFGGMRREMRLRYPKYWSDIKDAFHIQCLASFFFVTFGVIALAVTFGKLLLKYTDGYMGDSEMLLATSFSCILMAIVGTEPHTVLSGTAAMVIIETVIYKASGYFDIEYLPWRLWIGLWIGIILVLILAWEKTYWITYCTRFTEEILHSLIAILFIMEAFKDIYKVFRENPIHDSYNMVSKDDQNKTAPTLTGRPNTALLHTIILFSTFGIAVGLRLFQETRYFSPPVRRLLNFFSIPVAVTIMLIVCNFLNVYLNTVELKPGISLTSQNRTWLINPSLSGKGKLGWGMAVLAVFPAFFVVIVIFIETEITILMCYK
ncbi:anion exchange protein 3-like isoform X2 [Dendronephthya gigantea]|nr:anion exchange protein 3-like isoform X2 [Dendronephthya gigantea]